MECFFCCGQLPARSGFEGMNASAPCAVYSESPRCASAHVMVYYLSRGEVAEWLMAAVLKTVGR